MPLTDGETTGVVLGCFLVSFCVLLLLVKLYAKLTCGVCTSQASMKGKTVIITGATSGIGMETARDLAHRGARIILACRDTEAGYRFKDIIANEADNNFILVKKLDLSSQESVRTFAAEVIKTEESLDVLIINAAVGLGYQKQVSVDGFDFTMATNYFGPFLLIHLLIDLMKRQKSSRVVVVGTAMYWMLPKFDVTKLNPVEHWLPIYVYFYSKYAIMMIALELARRLENHGVSVNTLHPGVQYTKIWWNAPRWFVIGWFRWWFKSASEGAQTSIHCAVSEQVQGVTGKYFFDCKEKALTRQIQDQEKAKQLWDLTADLVLKTSDPAIGPAPMAAPELAKREHLVRVL